ncbi:MAG: DUF5305 family protein [Bacilli bacterium]|nr:DUF5305 family protein [Bacilli bacterium]
MDKDKIELPLLKGSDREKAIPLAVVFGIIGMLVIVLIGCLSLTIKGEYTLTYSDKSKLDYNVYLKENDYFPTPYLPKDQQYVSSLIDYIDADFNYSFKSEENIGIEYSYYVKASVRVDNADGKNIFKEDENLVEKTKVSNLTDDSFSITENVKLNYDKYNKLATSFVEQFNISANSSLVVSLYVDVVGKHADFDKTISDKAVITLTIPLTTRQTDIKMDYKTTNTNDAILQYKSTMITNPVLFTFAVILAILDVVAIIAVIAYVIANRDNQTLYNKKLNKILKDYDKYISETVITERVEDMMRTRSLRIEVIKSFDDLIDVRDNLEKPILYHEERPGEEAVFYILAEKVGYIYVMRASEMRKGKKKND